MIYKSIDVGSIVDVNFVDGSKYTDAKVLYTPADTGDLWHFGVKGKTIYLNPVSSNFESIILKEKQSEAI